MELEEMKIVWEELSTRLDQQQKLTHEIIIKMTQQQYQQKVNKIFYPEVIGSFICFTTALFILFHFNRLNTLLSFSLGIFSVLILISIALLTLYTMFNLKNLDLAQSTPREILDAYHQKRRIVRQGQKAGLLLSLFLIFTILPVFAKIGSGKDILPNAQVWWWYLPIMAFLFLGLVFFFGRFYANVFSQTEKLIKDLDNME